MDAIRVSDGLPVIFKTTWLEDESSAVDLLQYFGQEERRADPRNHCVPLLDVLRPEAYPDRIILVFPRMLPWAVWPFHRVSEVVDLLSQVFDVRPSYCFCCRALTTTPRDWRSCTNIILPTCTHPLHDVYLSSLNAGTRLGETL